MTQEVLQIERSIKERREWDVKLTNYWLTMLILAPITLGIYPLVLFFKQIIRVDKFIQRKRKYYDGIIKYTEKYLKEKNPLNKVFIVHRLDRDTSGVMIFAKSEEMQQKLQSDWSNLVTERKYIAIVEGRVEKLEDTIESYLRENSVFITISSKTDEFGGKLAVSHYKVIDKSPAFSMLEVKIDTGRKNQIRAHMKDLGHPIVGDSKYGAKKNPLGRLGLHAKTINFVHPKSGKTLEFISPIPARFGDMFKKRKDKKD